MSWILVALLAPFCWSVANYLDKYVLSRAASASGGSYGLLILSSAVSVVIALGVAGVAGVDTALAVNVHSRWWLVLSGVAEAWYLLFYFLALEKHSATTVNVLFQLAPILSILFGFVFLHESIQSLQLLAVALILVGSILVVWQKGKRLEMHGQVVWLMVLASTFMAVFLLLFKVGGGEEIGFWQAVFWQYLGIGVVGAVLACIPFAREDFVALLRGRGPRMLSVTMAAEGANVGAIIATNAAVLVAPIGLVSAVASSQPIIVLLEGIILAMLFPKLKDVFSTPPLTVRLVIGILLACVGGFLIFL